ncbi:response regulator [Metabacillus sediminilitoris]|uniref:Response regulator n=1 Tax=Metabacillus sediminilitoris TaxID=2567941 RepID=A0A4S4C5C2_9BACI|nr:response regulator [Metabacillus sediminilitoris]QGQ47984.1 response regulator [Metabacillus sediminilitoris]THF80902.1 response regulator [Metabacillus sediminilitoris]
MLKSPIKVMIIEDDETAIKIYEKFTHKIDGFQVVATTSTGKQALELINVFTPDLILLDVFLPDIKGTDLLWEIRKQLRSVDVILITAANDVDTVSEAIRGGAFSYLMKPIMIDKFLDTLEKYKETRLALLNLTTVEQEDVNSFFRMNSREEHVVDMEKAGGLPKGIDKHTLKKVRQSMKEMKDSINAEEFAKILGASHSTVRRYLEYLVANDEMEVEILYGTIGRPERRYLKK